jgi:hypothetical protein
VLKVTKIALVGQPARSITDSAVPMKSFSFFSALTTRFWYASVWWLIVACGVDGWVGVCEYGGAECCEIGQKLKAAPSRQLTRKVAPQHLPRRRPLLLQRRRLRRQGQQRSEVLDQDDVHHAAKAGKVAADL